MYFLLQFLCDRHQNVLGLKTRRSLDRALTDAARAIIVFTTIVSFVTGILFSMTPMRVANTKSKGLAAEIGKTSPFQSATQEAYLNLIRTAAILSNQLERLFKTRGLSESTYNILRILRGVAGLQGVGRSKYGEEHTRAGLPLTDIGERMIAPVPDVTRLIDRLERLTFATRRRCDKDRRVIYACITDAGLDVLREFDESVLEIHDEHLGHMSHQELEQMSELLEKAREAATKQRDGRNTDTKRRRDEV